jgi:hypothetical protein
MSIIIGLFHIQINLNMCELLVIPNSALSEIKQLILYYNQMIIFFYELNMVWCKLMC